MSADEKPMPSGYKCGDLACWCNVLGWVHPFRTLKGDESAGVV